jgi:hypothetical protein
MEAQRTDLLSLSLNVSTIDRAIRGFNDSARRPPADAWFTWDTAPWITSEHEPDGQFREPMDAVERLACNQIEMLDELQAADEQYRNLLSVSASLTSSMQALRASRIARWIAATLLVVSLLLLSLADTAQNPYRCSVAVDRG